MKNMTVSEVIGYDSTAGRETAKRLKIRLNTGKVFRLRKARWYTMGIWVPAVSGVYMGYVVSRDNYVARSSVDLLPLWEWMKSEDVVARYMANTVQASAIGLVAKDYPHEVDYGNGLDMYGDATLVSWSGVSSNTSYLGVELFGEIVKADSEHLLKVGMK